MPLNTPSPLGRTLVVACGALVRELRQVLDATNPEVAACFDVQYLPAPLHNRPQEIPGAVVAHIGAKLTPDHDRVLLGYGDCGTGGLLDAELDRLRAEGVAIDRLPGDHCYEFLAGSTNFHQLHSDELGTFFLTDYLARHFDTLIWKTFRFDQHPELIPLVFANYTRLVHLSQSADPAIRSDLEALASLAADRLGLRFETKHTGLQPLTEVFLQQTENPTTSAAVA